MKEINLLIAEDEDQVFQDSFVDIIEDFNGRSTEYKIIYKEHRCRTAEQAKEKLSTTYYDGAIIDLRLSKTEKSETAKGNEVLEEIIGKLRFPVVVYSNNLPLLSDKIRDQESDFLIIENKEKKAVLELIEDIISIYDTGITNIVGRKGVIEEYLDEIFWQHLSSSIKYWKEHKNERTLLRYTLMHLMEYLDLDENNKSAFEPFVPAEFYISPPVKENTFTGDLVRDNENEYWVILNPACDMDLKPDQESRNAEYILLVKAVKVREKLDVEEGVLQLSNNKKEKLKNLSKKERFYLLPNYSDIPAMLLDFQNIQVIKDSELNQLVEKEEYTRVSTINSVFLKNIINKYSSYLARQGAPDFDNSLLYDNILK